MNIKKYNVKFISLNNPPSSLTFHCKLTKNQTLKTYHFKHNEIFKVPLYVFEHLNRCGNNNVQGRDKFELIMVENNATI